MTAHSLKLVSYDLVWAPNIIRLCADSGKDQPLRAEIVHSKIWPLHGNSFPASGEDYGTTWFAKKQRLPAPRQLAPNESVSLYVPCAKELGRSDPLHWFYGMKERSGFLQVNTKISALKRFINIDITRFLKRSTHLTLRWDARASRKKTAQMLMNPNDIRSLIDILAANRGTVANGRGHTGYNNGSQRIGTSRRCHFWKK